MQTTLEQLESQTTIPGLKFEAGAGGLIKAVVDTQVCRGEVFLHGAHVTQFQPCGAEPILWMSQQSHFAADKPIRGGIPLCFPWFGPHPSDTNAPAHGWARLSEWRLGTAELTADGGVRLSLQTEINDFQLTYHVEFGAALELSFEVQLSADAQGPQSFEEALHTYLAVKDVRDVWIEGLERADYIDKVDDARLKSASGEPIRITGECDRVYLDTTSTCRLHDPQLSRVVEITKSGSRASVVWNPWVAKSARMPDFGDDEWPGMVCIESANVGQFAVQLAPGELHQLAVSIRLL